MNRAKLACVLSKKVGNLILSLPLALGKGAPFPRSYRDPAKPAPRLTSRCEEKKDLCSDRSLTPSFRFFMTSK